MKSIKVDFILVLYGNNDTVPVLTEEDAPLFIKWYLEALDDLKSFSNVTIELLSGSEYLVSWNDVSVIDEQTLSDPDPYGSYPFEIRGHKFMVTGQIIL